MAKILIVGAGPVGLYTAIRLSRQGHEVQVADQYIGKFVRPGVVAINAGETISENLAQVGIPLKFPTSSSNPDTYNISDLQKGLFNVAQQHGVIFHSANFERIEGGEIYLEDVSTSISCDLLIDCSGENRAIIENVNELHPDTFKITKISENPVKSHFIAFIQLNKNDADLVSSARGFSSVLQEMRTLESLKLQGWPHEGYPAWDTRRWERGEEVRMSCYLEIPNNVATGTQENQVAWLGTMLELKAGEKIGFKIEPGPLRFSAFKVDPHKVTNSIYQGDNFPFAIATCGDALISAEYRLGTGISNGIDSANGLIDAIRIDDKQLVIDKNAFDYRQVGVYGRNTLALISTHEKHVKELYEKRSSDLAQRPNEVPRLEALVVEYQKNPMNVEIKEFLAKQVIKVKAIADGLLGPKKYKEAAPVYEAALKAINELEKHLHGNSYELVNLYNLKSRICSNLETISKNLNNPKDAIRYIEEALKINQVSLAMVKELPVDEQQQKLEAELIKWQERLEIKYSPYQKAELSTHQAKEDLHQLKESTSKVQNMSQDEETKKFN